MTWIYEPMCYVRVRQADDLSVLGWLGRTDDGFATWIAADASTSPGDLSMVLKVCWAHVQAEPGVVYGDETPDDFFLCAPDYPAGARYLGGQWTDGYGVYWDTADNDRYPLGFTPASQSLDESVGTVTRLSDNGSIYSYEYNGNKMTYGKRDNNKGLLFEFVPVASFGMKERDQWMARLNSVIGDRPLLDIVIPGSHDAGCWKMTRVGAGITSRTQSLTIYQQLMAGSRFLDLRARQSNGTWSIKHGSDWADVTLSEVAEQMKQFLDSHPGEIVLASLLLESADDFQFSSTAMTGWNVMFDVLAPYHFDFTKADGTFNDITTVTPNSLAALRKNLLLFSWGPSTGKVWGSGPGRAMDREGVYAGNLVLLPSEALPSDIAKGVDAYNPPAGSLWILHTNTPYGTPLFESLYKKAEDAQPKFAGYFANKRWGSKRLNIINADFIGELDWVGPIVKLNET